MQASEDLGLPMAWGSQPSLFGATDGAAAAAEPAGDEWEQVGVPLAQAPQSPLLPGCLAASALTTIGSECKFSVLAALCVNWRLPSGPAVFTVIALGELVVSAMRCRCTCITPAASSTSPEPPSPCQ